jgi:hypothetical protein
MAWPGLTALLGLVGNDKGSEGLFFLPPGGGGGEGAGSASPDRENPPPTDLDPGNKDPIVLTRVEIGSNSNSFPLGTHKDLQLTAIYSNNTNNQVTDLVNWISDDETIIEIDTNQEDHPGRVIARSLGTTTIRSSFQGKAGSIELTVTNAALIRIEADPSNLSIIRGMSSEFHITGIYTDGSTEDLTDNANTSYSFTTDIATPNQPTTSRMRGLSVGSSALTIAHTAPGGTFQDTMNITVTSPALVSIQTEPENPSRALGLTKQFTATGIYENGETQDITEDVTWISQDPTKAIFYAHPIPKGEIQTLEEGTVPIQAQLGTVFSNTTTLTITQKQLTSIAISPSSYNLAKGLNHNFTATGTFTDNTTEDITDEVTWSSSNPSVATISNASPNRGRTTALEIGSTSIQASYSTFSASAVLNVTSAILTSLAVVPNNAETVSGEFRQYSAIGTYSDASTQDLTALVTWSISPSSRASISNSSGNQGRLEGISAGSVTITANHTSPNLSATANGTILAADTTPPTILSATSLSPTTVQVTFSEAVNSIQATNVNNFKIARTVNLSGTCSNNSNFSSPQTTDFTITSVTPYGGSGAVYVLHLSASQTYGLNYTLIGNKTGISDLADNFLGCSNSASFEGQAMLRVTSATCNSLNRIALTFSKPVLGGNVAGSAECDSIASCSQKYRLVDTGLGSITSAHIFDGTVCGGAPANSSRLCITHSLLQGGSNYNIIAANGIDGDGFNDASYGAIRDFTNSEDLQSNPRDRAGFSGCGVAPNNFADGPISTDTFGDGTSFGYLTNYNNQIYVGPNAKGNSAARFNFDGTSPQNVGFTIEKHVGHSNTASSRDGGIGVPPFVTMGHSGCTLNNANLTEGCGPDNENGRGSFSKVELHGSEFLIMGGSRNVDPNDKMKRYKYIYMSSDTGETLNFKWIRLGVIAGDSTEGVQSFVSLNNRVYAGFAKLNEPFTCTGMPEPCGQLSRNTPDFGVIRFKTGATDNNACGIDQNCDAGANTRGTRFRIDNVDYFGGTNANNDKTITDNWGKYVGIDSLFVFRNRIYGANGGHHKVNHNGSIIRSNSDDPGICNSGQNNTCESFTEIGPRSHPFWHGTGTNENRWFSIELRKAADFSPADHAFAQFTEYKGNLYVTRTICDTAQSSAATHAATFFMNSIAGCTDGTFNNRKPQLWKCVPETTGNANTCEAGDWSVVGDNGTGISNFGSSSNHSATMIVANGNYLYYGMDNQYGVQVWRTNIENPSSNISEWERINTDGFGDTDMRNIFSAISVPVGSQKFVYISVGKNGTPLKIFRQQND